MKMRYISKITRWGLLLFVLSIGACKKDKTPDEPKEEECGTTKQTSTTDRVALTNDSIFLYAKAIYYWNEELPCYDQFEPRQYTSGSPNLAKYEHNLLAIAQSTENQYDVLTYEGQDYTKFSYIEDVSGNDGGATAGIKNLTSGVNLQGEGNDIGIYYLSAYYESEQSEDFKLFITAVYPGSPAASAGLTRGATITKIETENIGDNWDKDVPFINKLLNDPTTIHMEGKKTDGTSYSVTLTKKKYDSSPIYKDSVLTIGGKHIGYLAYARFSDEDNSYEPLDEAFEEFAAKGIEDLVVDLRYNGGGYVSTAEYLANLIVPNGTTGTMFVEKYNQSLQEGKKDILKNQPVRDGSGQIIGKATYADFDYKPQADDNTKRFAKKGNLNGVKNVVFLVTGNTASASELLINSLRAVSSIRVQLVGTTTYGKPVGFFPIRLEGIYDLYLPSFSTVNVKGEGDYYEGFTPGDQITGKEMVDKIGQDLDNFSDADFGDQHELYLAAALDLLGINITSNSTLMSKQNNQATMRSVSNGVSMLHTKPEYKDFKGMIETRVK